MARSAGSVLVAAAILLLLSAGAAIADAEADIRSRLQQWADTVNGRDGAVCDLFAPDLVSSFPGVPDKDFAQTCTRLQGVLGDPASIYEVAADIEEVLVSGDLAVVRLTWTERFGEAGAPAKTEQVRSLDVFRRQPDGVWRITRFLAFPVEP